MKKIELIKGILELNLEDEWAEKLILHILTVKRSPEIDSLEELARKTYNKEIRIAITVSRTDNGIVYQAAVEVCDTGIWRTVRHSGSFPTQEEAYQDLENTLSDFGDL